MRALAARDLRYLGLIGSRAKVVRIAEALMAERMPPECLDRVHAPIGLNIGAVTPAEIAISILAELIAVRRGVPTTGLSLSSVRRARSRPEL
jgi:xanthine dehydrogenase accessory factor